MYKKYEILKLLVSFCRFVNLQIVRTKTFIRKRRRRLLTLVTVNKGRSPSNGKLSYLSFYIDSQKSAHRKFKK